MATLLYSPLFALFPSPFSNPGNRRSRGRCIWHTSWGILSSWVGPMDNNPARLPKETQWIWLEIQLQILLHLLAFNLTTWCLHLTCFQFQSSISEHLNQWKGLLTNMECISLTTNKGHNPNQLPSTGRGVPMEHVLHPAVGDSHRGLLNAGWLYPLFPVLFSSCFFFFSLGGREEHSFSLRAGSI